ncbi:AAA family ATPase [Sporofaciens sp. JLR.KK001]|uniref:AAA family ATPase n=1 Tax=Sporofaciens sp. JLR.KK001 TaxID=3112621 RepID=UPI002FF08D28
MIAAEKANLKDIKNSLLKLTQLMELYYRKPVILIIDEYDVPLAKSSEKGYYTEMLDTVKGILQVIKNKVLVKKYVGLAECPDFGTPKVVSYDYLMNFEVIII